MVKIQKKMMAMLEFKGPRNESGMKDARNAKEKFRREPKVDRLEEARRPGQRGDRRVFDEIVLRMHELNCSDPLVRNCAREFIHNIGEGAVPTLSQMLNDKDTAERAANQMLNASKRQLNRQADKADKFNPEVVRRKVARIRFVSALLLGEIASRVDSKVKEQIESDLLCSLKDTDVEIRYRIISALCRIGDSAHRALQPLIAKALDKNEQLKARHKAIEFIRKTRIMAKPAINTFIGMAKDARENGSIKRVSIEALGELGKYTEGKVQKSDVFETLIDRFDEQNPDLRSAASRSLVKLESSYVSDLFEVLNNPFRSTRVKLNVVITLSEIYKKKESTRDLISSKFKLMREIDDDPQNMKKMRQEIRSKIDEVTNAFLRGNY